MQRGREKQLPRGCRTQTDQNVMRPLRGIHDDQNMLSLIPLCRILASFFPVCLFVCLFASVILSTSGSSSSSRLSRCLKKLTHKRRGNKPASAEEEWTSNEDSERNLVEAFPPCAKQPNKCVVSLESRNDDSDSEIILNIGGKQAFATEAAGKKNVWPRTVLSPG